MLCINCERFMGCPVSSTNGGGCDIDGVDDFGRGRDLIAMDSIPEYDEEDDGYDRY